MVSRVVGKLAAARRPHACRAGSPTTSRSSPRWSTGSRLGPRTRTGPRWPAGSASTTRGRADRAVLGVGPGRYLPERPTGWDGAGARFVDESGRSSSASCGCSTAPTWLWRTPGRSGATRPSPRPWPTRSSGLGRAVVGRRRPPPLPLATSRPTDRRCGSGSTTPHPAPAGRDRRRRVAGIDPRRARYRGEAAQEGRPGRHPARRRVDRAPARTGAPVSDVRAGGDDHARRRPA